MHRSIRIALAGLLAVSTAVGAVSVTGCAPDTRAADALKKGNAALAAYAKVEESTATKIAFASTVQPTPEGVKPGLQKLIEVSKQMPARKAAAAAALAQFKAFKAAATEPKQKVYADKAIALAEGLMRLDAAAAALTANMSELYTDVTKNSSDTDRVVALADAVSKGQVAYDKASAQVKTLSDAADQYFQANLAVKQ
jgi:uncharacterized coiled-coil DUF342 family protein